MTTTKNKMTHHNGDQKKKHKKKVLLLALLLPLGFLAVAGATVGGLVAGKVFAGGHRDSTKTPLSTVFGSSTINGNHMFMQGQDTPIPADIDIDPDSVWEQCLLPNKGSAYAGSVRNDLVYTWPSWNRNGEAVNIVTVSAKNTSAEYEGSVDVTFVLAPGVNPLSEDLKTVNIDLTTLGSPYDNVTNVSESMLYKAIQASSGAAGANSNSNLRINDIKLKYDTTPTSGSPNYQDWNWTTVNNFGVGGTGENQTVSLWSNTNVRYEHIQISPNGASYYAGSDPVAITVILYRPDLSTIPEWTTLTASPLGTYIVDPSKAQLKTDFKNKVDATTGAWKTKFYANNANYSFSTPSNLEAYLTYDGNPYYNSMTGAKTTTASVFTYAYETKLQIGSTAPATILTDAQVPNLDGYFFEKPINVEVRDAILNKCSAANTWLWSQFDMNIAAGNASGSSVTISAKTGSLYYTGTRTITFQYKS